MPSPRGLENLAFRCTGCGACCKEPMLPLTERDLRQIVRRTGDTPAQVIRWVDKNAIDLDDEPEAFVDLPRGKRVMVLRQRGGKCRYLDARDRCTIYGARPLGCRLFPFDPTFGKTNGKLRRLEIVQATEHCPYELDGDNDPDKLRRLKQSYDAAYRAYYDKVAEWNRTQRQRRRSGKPVGSPRRFLAYLGF